VVTWISGWRKSRYNLFARKIMIICRHFGAYDNTYCVNSYTSRLKIFFLVIYIYFQIGAFNNDPHHSAILTPASRLCLYRATHRSVIVALLTTDSSRLDSRRARVSMAVLQLFNKRNVGTLRTLLTWKSKQMMRYTRNAQFKVRSIKFTNRHRDHIKETLYGGICLHIIIVYSNIVMIKYYIERNRNVF